VNDDQKFYGKKFSDDLRERIHSKVEASMNTGDEKQEKHRRPIVIGIHLGKRSCGGGLLWGLILIAIGLVLLLDHMGIISVDHLWRFWPLLLIVAGASNVMAPERRLWGIVLIIAGTLLQLNQLGISHFGWADFWPIILISIGVLVLWGSFEARRRPAVAAPRGGDPRTTLNESVVFGGIERRITSQDFQGGNVNAVFGGVEIDLSEASMQADEATLEINAIFGGVELRVPATWQVAFRGSPIFGGIADKTRTAREDDPDRPKGKTLILTGAIIFGGVEIKN